jgi:hypothetical protein
MGEFVTSGNIVLLALAVLLLEALLMTAFRHRLPADLPPLDIALMALPGAGLLMAMYSAMTHAPWQSVTLYLSLALISHVADLARRCRPPLRGRP